jgi:formylglycine-generating enzyme
VNVSKEAAMLFCSYLTNYYSGNENQRRKFKRAKFRLPTEQEWMMAARAAEPNAKYSWKGNSVTDKNGKVRANFHRPGGDTTSISGYLTTDADIIAPVRSYDPNGFGIYNLSGNVAEIILDKNIVKGGSWKDDEPALLINASKPYTGPSATIGFRYVMIVKE